MQTSEEWYEIGFAEGAQAGSAEMALRRQDFGPHEAGLAMGHDILDGVYNIVRRRQQDFHTIEQGSSWFSGVHAGVASVDARVGFETGVEDLAAGPNGGVVLYIFVTKAFRPASVMLN